MMTEYHITERTSLQLPVNHVKDCLIFMTVMLHSTLMNGRPTKGV